jgi:hypothetical protein
MYRDVWDQKPPGIALRYAVPSSIWPHDSLVPAADLAAAVTVAVLLVVVGRRRFTSTVGYGAAVLFLLLGDPNLTRLSGVYVRGQCEPFMSVAIAAGLVLLAARVRTRAHLAGAGVALAAAFWLKYNAAAYGLVMAAAVWAWGRGGRPVGETLRETLWLGFGFVAVGAAVIGYFAWHGALLDLRLATIDYNLAYSNETYESPVGIPRYLLTMPFERARADMLWFLGGLGTLLLAGRAGGTRSSVVALAWVVSALASIAINGSRGLPNYFVQAAPALALAASAGLGTLRIAPSGVRLAVAGVVALGLWRVGADRPVWGLRLAGLPGVVRNVAFDLSYIRGVIDRETYLRRFRGVKFDAFEIEALAAHVRAQTAPADRVFVFGFSGGSVGWKAERASASRFFWSRPVIIDFAAGRAGYGRDGLAADLRRRPPAIVALQKDEWRSRDHFLSDPRLRDWLEAGYEPVLETAMFSVWHARR